MKTCFMLMVTALTAWVMSQPVLAYTLSPPKTVSKLSGTLGFVTDGGGTAFSCDVRFTLRTHVPKAGEISHAQVRGPGLCKQVIFVTTPWEVQIQNAQGGVVFGAGWTVGSESCGHPGTGFTDNGAGVWSFGPGCLSGAMTSTPPITIVP
jgi:hypothetical protein